jgi:hypothetical protein
MKDLKLRKGEEKREGERATVIVRRESNNK